jgi:hypothetical protein
MSSNTFDDALGKRKNDSTGFDDFVFGMFILYFNLSLKRTSV